ncbi:methyltransferase domain-containing protein [Sphaerisporangium album]|uniref:Methyltransferase domain-containing protein n=1 Tax=Sphaerisporangium album TaxID=509200 RepID=A0A367FFS4_9ACTN|nr:methyltransferase domain-containing protein [Sphaerisporangium album]RCG28739.1 methyltransferase domain-containing protein [Sphaerisporangium album]
MIGDLYAASLDGAPIEVEYVDGRVEPLRAARWREPIDGDHAMLARCSGPTLDVGSGPGRLTVALTRRGVPALGIDVTPHAVRLTRESGGAALCRDVFAPVPGTGRWATLLLADGNIGIGADPVALLRRARRLLRPGGEVVAELEPPGVPSRVDRVRLRVDPGRPDGGNRPDVGCWFGWARVSVTDIARLAHAGGFPMVHHWQEAGRWFASLR